MFIWQLFDTIWKMGQKVDNYTRKAEYLLKCAFSIRFLVSWMFLLMDCCIAAILVTVLKAEVFIRCERDEVQILTSSRPKKKKNLHWFGYSCPSEMHVHFYRIALNRHFQWLLLSVCRSCEERLLWNCNRHLTRWNKKSIRLSTSVENALVQTRATRAMCAAVAR